jgi:two-component system NarL family sensor kinase
MQNAYPEIYTQFLTNILIVSILIGFIVFLTLSYQKKKLAQKKELELLKSEIEKEFIATRLEIQEEVLREVSMEIHDNVGQTLLLTNVNFAILHRQLDKSSKPYEMVGEIKDLLSKAMDDLTNLSRSIHPDKIIEIGAFQAMENELLGLQSKGIFQVSVDIAKEIRNGLNISPEVHVLLFRIYQELLKNIIKHAEASAIELKITQLINGLVIILSDNGKGFDASKNAGSKGIGLSNIEKRLQRFKGHLKIHSHEEAGTSMEIFIPHEVLTMKAK